MNFKELDNIAKIAMAEELDEERTEICRSIFGKFHIKDY
jgi:hypothetical protein